MTGSLTGLSAQEWEQVWETCRSVNIYASIVAMIGVLFRLTLMILDRPRWQNSRARHLLAWFTYIVLGLFVASRASAHYDAVGADANWTSGARMLLTLIAIVLVIWWPHPLRYVHIEGHHWYDDPAESETEGTEGQ